MRHLHAALLSLALTGALSAQNHVCTVTAAGDGCAPLTVTLIPQGNGGAHDLSLHATGLHPRSAGAMVWGMNQLNVPIVPGSLCPLLTDYVWGHYFQTDPLGEVTISRSWPGWFNGYFYMQMGSIRAQGGLVDVKTTDCKLAQCLVP